ncbi:MAG: AAA family ATPase [Planctomycetes bacterium]|nr:AAA family ATPase [Planctomycetota bacterium]
MAAIRITRIEISGYRGIRERLTLDLGGPDRSGVPQFVLAGQNGCGKTSVLEAVVLALGREDLLVRDLHKDQRTRHGRTQLPHGAEIRIVLRRGQQEEEFTLPAGPDRRPPRIEELAYFSSWRAPHLVGSVQPLVRGRRPDDTEANRLWRLKQRIIDERAKTAFATGQASADQGLGWLAKVNRAWQRLHGDDSKIVAGLVDPASQDAYADLFVEKDAHRVCSIDEASSGEIELLSFAGWIALTGFEEGLLVIDEPELHLHPEWQAGILPALRELAPRAQFLVATHVDAPWNRAHSWERALLVPPSDPRSARSREQAREGVREVDG